MKKKSQLLSFFLKTNKKDKTTGQYIAKALNYLAKYEIQEGGPYYDENKNIDLGLNVVIAHFLKKQKVALPNLDKLIKKHIKDNKFNSTYFTPKLLKTLAIDLYAKEPELSEKNPNIFLKKIIQAADRRFKNLNPEFKKLAKDAISRTIQRNLDGQMSLMPYYFKKALGKKGEKIDDLFIAELGLANTFFWTAFIIYDDFWDEDEKAAPCLLPIANLMARSYISYFNTIFPENNQFKKFFTDLMDKLDSANTWETLHCRTEIENDLFYIPAHLPNYQDYTKKFEPASGHILGCIAILTSLGIKINNEKINNLISYFKNYLIAMQLNDDAHDLQEDLSRGHLSTVVVMFLNDWQKKYPGQKTINLKNDLEKIQQLFWFTTVKKSCRITINYTNKAKKALTAMTFLEHPEYLEKFINISEKVAKIASLEQKKSSDLLQAL